VDKFLVPGKVLWFSPRIFFEEQIGIFGWSLHQALFQNPFVMLWVPLWFPVFPLRSELGTLNQQ